MNSNKQEKQKVIKEISSKLSSAKSLVVAEYAGITVKQIQELRAELRENGVELKVYKNRLFNLAAKEQGFKELESSLQGPNIYAFGNEDEISPAKIIAKFAKKYDLLSFKAGIYEGKVIGAEEVEQIAKLPSLEEALTMLATSLLAPVNQVGKGLQLLIDENKLEA